MISYISNIRITLYILSVISFSSCIFKSKNVDLTSFEGNFRIEGKSEGWSFEAVDGYDEPQQVFMVNDHVTEVELIFLNAVDDKKSDYIGEILITNDADVSRLAYLHFNSTLNVLKQSDEDKTKNVFRFESTMISGQFSMDSLTINRFSPGHSGSSLSLSGPKL